jgi:hypothetical protein
VTLAAHKEGGAAIAQFVPHSTPLPYVFQISPMLPEVPAHLTLLNALNKANKLRTPHCELPPILATSRCLFHDTNSRTLSETLQCWLCLYHNALTCYALRMRYTVSMVRVRGAINYKQRQNVSVTLQHRTC